MKESAKSLSRRGAERNHAHPFVLAAKRVFELELNLGLTDGSGALIPSCPSRMTKCRDPIVLARGTISSEHSQITTFQRQVFHDFLRGDKTECPTSFSTRLLSGQHDLCFPFCTTFTRNKPRLCLLLFLQKRNPDRPPQISQKNSNEDATAQMRSGFLQIG